MGVVNTQIYVKCEKKCFKALKNASIKGNGKTIEYGNDKSI